MTNKNREPAGTFPVGSYCFPSAHHPAELAGHGFPVACCLVMS